MEKKTIFSKEVVEDLLAAVRTHGVTTGCKAVAEKYGVSISSLKSFFYRKKYHRAIQYPKNLLPSLQKHGENGGAEQGKLNLKKALEDCLTSSWKGGQLEELLKKAAELSGGTVDEAVRVFCSMVKNGSPIFATLSSWDKVAVVGLLLRQGLSLEEMGSLTGAPVKTLERIAAVAKKFSDPASREPALSYTHHRVVAPLELDEARKWLKRALENSWSAKALLDAIAGREVAPRQDRPSLEQTICERVAKKGGLPLDKSDIQDIAARAGTDYHTALSKLGSMAAKNELAATSPPKASGYCKKCSWAKGDALLRYLEAGLSIGEAAKREGVTVGEAELLVEVCRKFPPDERVCDLPLSYHALATEAKDPHALLQVAAANGWGYRDLVLTVNGELPYKELAERYRDENWILKEEIKALRSRLEKFERLVSDPNFELVAKFVNSLKGLAASARPGLGSSSRTA